MARAIWVDASAGVAGDMLAAAFVDAGVPVQVMTDAVNAVLPDVSLSTSSVQRNGLAAMKFDVAAADDQPHRHLADIRTLLGALPAPIRSRAERVFERLAEVEAAAHGTGIEEVHFHEVGAADSIADIVSVCAALAHLDCSDVYFGIVELGTGTVRADHGELPVPTPAALRLSNGLQVVAGARGECATPTGLAVLTALGTQSLTMPVMRVLASGIGAGTRERKDRADVVRVVVGEVDDVDAAVLAEANVDDMDPRLWPRVLELLLAAGADDAWLTPIVMKKGRPANTLSVLCKQSRLTGLQQLVFEHTTTIGMRVIDIEKTVLERTFTTVVVDGQQLRVKIAGRAGRILNVSIEYDDIARAAKALACAERDVLQRAERAAAEVGAVVGGVFEAD